jgi:hypothetical protein
LIREPVQRERAEAPEVAAEANLMAVGE